MKGSHVEKTLEILRRFGTFIYTKDQWLDLDLMEADIREAYQMKMIDEKDFRLALHEIRERRIQLKGRANGNGTTTL